jgi:hypothetical protein
MSDALTPDRQRAADEYFAEAALDMIWVAWREVLGTEDDLPPEVEEAAHEELCLGGLQGIPGEVTFARLDPREVLARALEEVDPPRAKRLRDHVDRMPDVVQFRGRVLPREQGMAKMLRLHSRARRQLGLDPAHGAMRPHRSARAPRPVRRVSRVCGARGDPDDDPDLEPPAAPESAP